MVEQCSTCHTYVLLSSENIGAKICHYGTCEICGSSYMMDVDAKSNQPVMGPHWTKPEEVDLTSIIERIHEVNPDFCPADNIKEPLRIDDEKLGLFILRVDEDGHVWGHSHKGSPYNSR